MAILVNLFLGLAVDTSQMSDKQRLLIILQKYVRTHHACNPSIVWDVVTLEAHILSDDHNIYSTPYLYLCAQGNCQLLVVGNITK